jgi:hypothetical protein
VPCGTGGAPNGAAVLGTPGASAPSVRHRNYEMDHLAAERVPLVHRYFSLMIRDSSAMEPAGGDSGIDLI